MSALARRIAKQIDEAQAAWLKGVCDGLIADGVASDRLGLLRFENDPLLLVVTVDGEEHAEWQGKLTVGEPISECLSVETKNL